MEGLFFFNGSHTSVDLRNCFVILCNKASHCQLSMTVNISVERNLILADVRYVWCSVFSVALLFHFQKIHRAIEEEASIQARQPKKMKTFSESYKFEKNCSLVVSQVGVASSKEEATEVSSDDAKMPAKSSPRNNFLKKLGTRDRGSRSEKKTGVKK